MSTGISQSEEQKSLPLITVFPQNLVSFTA